jgi:hypothetical protein
MLASHSRILNLDEQKSEPLDATDNLWFTKQPSFIGIFKSDDEMMEALYAAAS